MRGLSVTYLGSNVREGELKQDISRQRFITLLQIHTPRIRVYIRTFVPHVPDAEDIMQETALVMWRRFDQFKEDGDFTAWGIGIARHYVLKLEQKRFDKRIKFSSEIVALLEKSVAAHSLHQDGRAAALQQCKGKLPSQDAELVRLKYDEGYSIVKIARVTGRPLQGLYKVMARIHRDLMYCVEKTLRAMNHET